MGMLVLLLLISIGTALAAIPIRIESFSCLGNDVYCTDLACSLETIRKRMQVMSFECTYPLPLDKLTIRFTLFKRHGAQYQQYLIDSTEDLCKVLDRTERSNVVSRLLPMWKHYGNFPGSCPIKGKIAVLRYPLDLSFFPSLFPSGAFKVTVQIVETNRNQSVLNATAMFGVRYS